MTKTTSPVGVYLIKLIGGIAFSAPEVLEQVKQVSELATNVDIEPGSIGGVLEALNAKVAEAANHDDQRVQEVLHSLQAATLGAQSQFDHYQKMFGSRTDGTVDDIEKIGGTTGEDDEIEIGDIDSTLAAATLGDHKPNGAGDGIRPEL